MLRRKETLTVITPIPGFIPRQLALDILHSHSEVITVNPLVLSHRPIPAPRTAAADEYYSTWYEILERIQYVPGLGKAGSGKITFKGCFHDMPWGLQTHIYAPMNVDLRCRYRIAGNQLGVEPPEHPEIGLEALGAPKEGLYLREDIEIKCNVAMMGFVKAEMKKASKEMVERIVKKAQLLDAGILQAMIENGQLKTINPADRSNPAAQQLSSPRLQSQEFSQGRTSPGLVQYQPPRSPGYPYSRPGTSSSQGYQSQQTPPPPQAAPAKTPTMVMELPGDYYHPQQSPGKQSPKPPHPSPGYQPNSYRGWSNTMLSSDSDTQWSHPR